MSRSLMPRRVAHVGVAYVDGPLSAHQWNNQWLLDGERGVMVKGTGDVEVARPLADHATKKWFGVDTVAAEPIAADWALEKDSEDELMWRLDPEQGTPGVLFTARPATATPQTTKRG